VKSIGVSTDYDYSGYAEVVFDEPRVELYGPASVKPDGDGRPIVEIAVDRSIPTVRTQFELMEVRYGSLPSPGGKVIAVGGDRLNRVRATVRGEKGVFQCGPDWSYDLSLSPDEQLTLRIKPLRSEFTVAAPAPETGAVFHEGFIDLDSPGTAAGELLGFILHLHDLVVRILLKIVGYRGTYQPRLIRATAAETVDWFKPGIQIDHLLKVPTLGIK